MNERSGGDGTAVTHSVGDSIPKRYVGGERGSGAGPAEDACSFIEHHAAV